MPPKRKAPEDTGDATNPSPPKRATRRSNAPAQRVSQNHDSPKNTSSVKKVVRDRNPCLTEDASPTTPTRHRKGLSGSPSKKLESRASSHKQPSVSTSLSREGSFKENAGKESDEADELNLSPPKPLIPPSTPGLRPSASRMIMECVEISTPRSIAKAHHTFLKSPVANSVAATDGKVAIPYIAPATPSRRARVESCHPASRSKNSRTPSTPLKKRPPETSQTTSPSRLSVRDTPGRRSVRGQPAQVAHRSPQPLSSLPPVLPAHLIPCFRLQQHVILSALQSPSDAAGDGEGQESPPTNANTYAQLQDLLSGTVNRGEGNSCLLVGPRGSGKTSLVEQAIRSLPEKPIVLRLSGYAQHNDRLALREIALQLSMQTGKSFFGDTDQYTHRPDEEPNPFLEPGPSVSLPPPSHLPALISILPTLSHPVLVVLDAFDLFAHHARQSLLYCLLDTVQSCRVGQGNNGLAVIGVTTRVDTINLLEKRVKSRFSGRILRTAPPSDFRHWMSFTASVLNTANGASDEEWEALWSLAVNRFLGDRKCAEAMKDMFALTRDFRSLKQLLTSIVVDLRPTSPFPTLSHVTAALSAQRVRQSHPGLHALSYPSICLLIAAVHAHTTGHDTITFEMLYDSFREQFRASSAAPIQIEGGSIGMARCTRSVLQSSFEQLSAARLFIRVAGPSANIAPEFVSYRCSVEREDVKRAVDTIGQTSLKKWLHKVS